MTIAMSKEEAHLYARDGYILRQGLLGTPYNTPSLPLDIG